MNKTVSLPILWKTKIMLNMAVGNEIIKNFTNWVEKYRNYKLLVQYSPHPSSSEWSLQLLIPSQWSVSSTSWPLLHVKSGEFCSTWERSVFFLNLIYYIEILRKFIIELEYIFEWARPRGVGCMVKKSTWGVEIGRGRALFHVQGGVSGSALLRSHVYYEVESR